MADYCVNPADQWYGRPFVSMGIRFSFFLAVATLVGFFLQRKKLFFGKNFLYKNEIYIFVFLTIVWLSSFLSPVTDPSMYIVTDSPAIKLTKVIIFVFLLTHIITDRKKIVNLFWVLISVSFLLGFKAYSAPYDIFVRGRLEGLGGADFSDANRFAGFMVAILFLVGVQFLRSGLLARIYSVLAGAFIANSLMLAGSRGAFLGLAVGIIFALVVAPKRYKGKLVILTLIACIALFGLVNKQVVDRVSTISNAAEERDSSAQSRLEIWEGGARMLFSNPVLGVGPGNFYTYIGNYQPKHPNRDAHNTLIRCGGELGFIGLGSFVLILISTLRLLWGCMLDADRLESQAGKDLLWCSYGTILGGTAMLVYGMTGTLLYTEYFWWFLAFPICIRRALDSEMSIAATGNLKSVG